MSKRPVSKIYNYLEERWYPFEKGLKLADPGIRDLVRDLNLSGYATRACCEGGYGHENTHAWIAFQDETLAEDRGEVWIGFLPEEISEIKEIVKRHTNVPFKFNGNGILFKGPLKERPYTKEELEGSGAWSLWDA